MDKWKMVLNFYKEKFGYPYWLTDFLAVDDILKRACMGYSNHKISNKTSQDFYYIRTVLEDYLQFSGWNSDLLYSPLAIYKENSTLDKFRAMVYNVDMFANEKILETAFEICERYMKFRKRGEEYGY